MPFPQDPCPTCQLGIEAPTPLRVTAYAAGLVLGSMLGALCRIADRIMAPDKALRERRLI